MPKLNFPDEFIFGTAVAAYQVEGNEDMSRKSDWDDFLEQKPAQIVRPGEIGPDWWSNDENLNKDIRSISELGVSMQRISIEWARIQPTKSSFDQNAIVKYRNLVDLLRQNGLEPMITLNHFVLPSWIGNLGSWENADTPKYFTEYVDKITEHFSDIKYWIIFNEPSVVTYLGYLVGIFPPGKQNLISAAKARNNIIKAQKDSYKIIKNKYPETQVGNAFSILWLRRLFKQSKIEKSVARFLNTVVNTNFIDATKNYMDFIGINYYTGYYINFNPISLTRSMRNEAAFVPYDLPFAKTIKPKTYLTDMGWPIVPDFFLAALRHIGNVYKKPIFITENGIADRDDVYRSFYIYTHLLSVYKALQDGIDIRGYLYWSALDNLEWVEGFAKRFGLMGVDPRSGIRKNRIGSETFKKIVKERSIDTEFILNNHIPEEEKIFAEYISDIILTSGTTHCPRINYKHLADKE